MINIAPLDYERYLALVGPFPLAEVMAKAASTARHTEELTQISNRMDLSHEFSAESEINRARLARQRGQWAPPVPDMPPVHTGPEPEMPWSVVIEATINQGHGGETSNSVSLRVAANLYHPIVVAPAPAISEIA
jgi:hypothetical protein